MTASNGSFFAIQHRVGSVASLLRELGRDALKCTVPMQLVSIFDGLFANFIVTFLVQVSAQFQEGVLRASALT